MAMSLLTIVQTVQAELGLFPITGTVQSSTEQTVMQMAALINRVGDEVMQRHDWTALRTTATLSLVAGQDTYSLPADFRHFVNRTQWDRTNHWELDGPVSPQEWQWLASGTIATGPRRRFRQIGRTAQAQIWPTPGASDTPATLAYDYQSAYWATNGGTGAAQARMSWDSDTAIFPDDVMVVGLKFRFFSAKGFDTSQLAIDYENAVRIAMAQDGGARTLNLGGRKRTPLLSSASVPDSGFGT